MKKKITILLYAFCAIQFQVFPQKNNAVKIWEEPLVIPTYLTGSPDPNPMFFQHESYQGASRVIYPYALNDNITDKKVDKTYKALYLENEYIKLCVLPEIGGRLFYATDKTNGYEIFYRQHVIKPANVGMLGAWISGGMEFCVFHHHRASTNLPVNYTLKKNEDGSATIWIGETEHRQRMEWAIGISLHPGKSYIELDGRLINSTENANSILYWTNAATHVNDNYQIIFPPSTDFATYHAKNSFCHWPVTFEPYVGKDYYKDSIDASWWKNHPNPVSFFVYDIKEGFLAGYDYEKHAGTMHVGNPNIIKGAKLWEWGPGADGSMWDSKVLTDNDGPYAELMAGAYSDNQPDYSWIKPYELKTFKQFWYPLRETEGAVAANLRGMLNMKKTKGGSIFIAANTTEKIKDALIKLEKNGQVLFEKKIDISPMQPFNREIPITGNWKEEDLTLSLLSNNNKTIVVYQPQPKKKNLPLPNPVKPPLAPAQIKSVEELYFTGLRIKQFHNAVLNPADYFMEALKRDSLDTRSNTQMGILCKEKGLYEEGARYFRTALARLTKDYNRPRNCEPLYHLGLILQTQGKMNAAYDTLYRAAWDNAFASPAYFHLAQISCSRGDYSMAREELSHSLDYNSSNLNAINLLCTVCRKVGDTDEALKMARRTLLKDILNSWANNEIALLLNEKTQNLSFKHLMSYNPESYLELATGYLNSGFPVEAYNLLNNAVEQDDSIDRNPTFHYYLGYISHILGNKREANQQFAMGQSLQPGHCFPFRLETVKIYETAVDYNPQDSRAYYYLGNLFYDKQPEKAIGYWEKATQLEPTLAIAYRNMGWGYDQTEKNPKKAIAAYEQAIKNDNTQPKYYYELDKLYEANGAPLEIRYKILAENHEFVAKRNDALIQEIKVLIGMGQYDKALFYLSDYFFYRQEGVDNLHDIYVDASLLRGEKYFAQGDYKKALEDFLNADGYPDNQQIGRDDDYERQAQIYCLTAQTYQKLNDDENSQEYYRKASKIKIRNQEFDYYKAIALQELGKNEEAAKLFYSMICEGEKIVTDSGETDFFSKFGSGQSMQLRKANGYYVMGLGYLGKNKTQEAISYLSQAVSLNPNHVWAKLFLNKIK